MPILEYPFRKQVAEILNAGAARTVILTGNVEDLFWIPAELAGDEDGLGNYVPLMENLTAHWGRLEGSICIVCTHNNFLSFLRPGDRETVKRSWVRLRSGLDPDDMAIQKMLVHSKQAEQSRFQALEKYFDDVLNNALSQPATAIALLQELCHASRTAKNGDALFGKRLLIFIDRADALIPEAPITQLNETDRLRVLICQKWFSDPEFLHGKDSVILLTESVSTLHHRIVRLPQVLRVEVPFPDIAARSHFITWFNRRQSDDKKIKLWGTQDELSEITAGLTIHALRQLLMGNVYSGEKLEPSHVLKRVEAYIESQLGEGVVRFKKPEHSLKDVVGARNLRKYLEKRIIPRIKAGGKKALSGFAVSGPIGGGKTFIFEAVAASCDMVVLELRNLRSKWFGETDMILERLYRLLKSLYKVLIIVDEADTVFGGVGADTHETERRLTGEIQKWMSDPILRGRVVWLLMTARIQNLSPDIRRPGRAGDLIIPVLDPEGEDLSEFIAWMLKPLNTKVIRGSPEWLKIEESTKGYSAADFGSLRAELIAACDGDGLNAAEILEITEQRLPSDIGQDREYQRLQALVNCTVLSLLPDGDTLTKSQAIQLKAKWAAQIKQMEARGFGR